MADVIEPAATGRAACRGCREKILKGELRFGERAPSAFGEGEQTLWFHVACAAERRPHKLADALREYPGEIPDRAALESVVTDGLSNPKLAEVARVERSPTGRATCQECHEKIGKDELRVAIEKDVEGMPPTTSFLHARCARKNLGDVGLENKLRRLAKNLSEGDLAKLQSSLNSAA
jgi:hypothetical protein